MQQRKSKKILIYLFLLILVGSINNIEINKIKFDNINKITINGLGENENKILLNDIKKLKLGNIFSIKKDDLSRIIEKNSLVQSYKIFKVYPSTLNIKILKTEYIAQINKENKIYFVGTNGKYSKNKVLKNDLPFIFGKPDIEKILKFKKIIDQSKLSYNQIKYLYYFPSGRWDIELINNILIKLPKDNIIEILDDVFDFINNNNFKKVKFYDARIKNQIIVND